MALGFGGFAPGREGAGMAAYGDEGWGVGLYSPSFRRKPESSVVISYYGNGSGKHRFRLAPE